MKKFRMNGKVMMLGVLLAIGVVVGGSVGHTQTPVAARSEAIRIEAAVGTIEVMAPGSTVWIRTQTNQVLRAFFRVRTGANSRATLRWSDRSAVPMGPLTEFEILPPRAAGTRSRIHLIRGVMSFFNRDEPDGPRVITRGAMAGTEGTEFVIAVSDTPGGQRTDVAVLDGIVNFSDAMGRGALSLTNSQQATVLEGQTPVLVAGFIADNLLQWACYYPAVLDLNDLELTAAERERLAPSLAAYREGDLHQALVNLPAGRDPDSNAGRLYHAALLLSVGQSTAAESHWAALVNPTAAQRRLAAALRLLAATANNIKGSPIDAPSLPTELLAASYYEQSRAVLDESLRRALELAREAVKRSPDFAFGWARVAELEFSFGRTRETLAALDRALALAPRHAQALAVKGFVLAARNQTREALKVFNEAIAADSSLGNAWLGRGLARIRLGDRVGGREDLRNAAVIEPKRAILRSYLGKAWNDGGDLKQALKELDLAKRLDPADPTPWLYSALLKEQGNQLNDAIRDLETARERNPNRRLLESSLRIERDDAVASVNQARLYRDLGMTDVGVRLAGRTVTATPLEYSAHAFVAQAVDQLRDPGRVNLRYETAALSEFLVANLLGPANATIVSPAASRASANPLLTLDGFEFVSATEYRDSGEWREAAALSLTDGGTSLAVDTLLKRDPGFRPNSDIDEAEVNFRWKQQVGTGDGLLFEVQTYRAEGGNRIQYESPALARIQPFRFEEYQDPIVTAGYHKAWSDEHHTLLVASHLQDRFSVENPLQPGIVVSSGSAGILGADLIAREQRYESLLQIGTGEAQHQIRHGRGVITLGGRFQKGHIHTRNWNGQLTAGDPAFSGFIGEDAQDVDEEFTRQAAYAYWNFELADTLTAVAGLTADRVRYPRNFRAAPVGSGRETRSALLPKAGLQWSPRSRTHVGVGYAQSLAGASIDQSYRLEPVQVAGIVSAYRSLIPESLGGSTTGEKFETLGGYAEHSFATRTRVAVEAAWLRSHSGRTIGVYEITNADVDGIFGITSVREAMEFDEKNVTLSLHQPLSSAWTAHFRYSYAQAELDRAYRALPPVLFSIGGEAIPLRGEAESCLQTVGVGLDYRDALGYFGRWEGMFFHQENESTVSGSTTRHPWQMNLEAGRQFWHRRMEAAVGVLNVTDNNFRLNPLNYHLNLPPERVCFVKLTLSF